MNSRRSPTSLSPRSRLENLGRGSSPGGSRANRAHGVAISHWCKVATKSGLNADQVEARVRAIAEAMLDHELVWDILPADLVAQMRAIIRRKTAQLIRPRA